MDKNTNSSSSSMEGDNRGGDQDHDGNIPNPRRPRSEENQPARNLPRPPPPSPQCPRCFSNDTKFCYYNNYNLAQPRYYCRACRRYWTQGGSLRNVPVGGGGRRGFRPYGPMLRLPASLPPPPPPPRQPTVDYIELRRVIPNCVTKMAGLVSGIAPITWSSGSFSWLSSMPTMDSIYPCGIFSVVESLENGQFGQNKPGGAPQPPAQPPLRIHDQPPPRAVPKPADQGDGGGNRKDKQPMYPPDKSVGALPAGSNNVASSSTSSNVWSNSIGASTSSGITEPSPFIPNEWPLDDDFPDFDDDDEGY